MNIEDNFIFRKKDRVIERLGEELLLFDSSKGILFEVNETGKTILIMLDGKHTVENIKDQLRKEFYEVGEIDKDISDFLNELLEMDIIEKLE
ncbi:MAG: PqqD family peptide modification chaperone [Candidatus Hodarchaeota archaeon]